MTRFSIGSFGWLKAGLLLPLVVLNSWIIVQIFQYFEPLPTILIGASVLAFVLNYPVEFLQTKLNRSYAIAIVIIVSLIGLLMLGITLVPVLSEQLAAILDQLPDLLNKATAQLQVVQQWATVHHLPIDLHQFIQQFTDRLPEQLDKLGDETISITLNAVGGLSSLLLTIVLMFYFLIDGKRVWLALFQNLPLANRDQVRQTLQKDFHHYFIGQATLGLCVATMLSIVLLVLHIPNGLMLGVAVGIMTLIPFGDVVGYILVCLFVAAHSPSTALITFGTVAVLDQLIDQAIAPRILGGFTGLKPIWVILSLLLGTKLFGFTGLLLAVPIASFISTLLEDNSLLEPETNLLADSSEKLLESSTNSAATLQALNPKSEIS